jgi:diguanylate cyclase
MEGCRVNGRLLGDEGRDLAHKALELMAQFDVPPTPENYSVWVSFASDANTELCENLRKHIDSGTLFTAELNTKLFEQYFQWAAVQNAILESGGIMTRELGNVQDSLNAATKDTAAYGATLAGAQGQLGDASDTAGVKTMVETLVSATARMQRRSAELENKLQATSQEVTQLRSNLEKVREEAMTDALTGVANRKRFDETLRRAQSESDAKNTPLSLVLCDIDFFKRFNDTWGHQTGDQIIRFVAGCMTRHASDTHLVARYGGEEFGIIMPNTTADEAFRIAELTRKTVASKKLLRKSTNEDLGKITVSMGIAEYVSGEAVEEFIERSDTNLYKSKADGRNRTSSEPSSASRTAA